MNHDYDSRIIQYDSRIMMKNHDDSRIRGQYHWLIQESNALIRELGALILESMLDSRIKSLISAS